MVKNVFLGGQNLWTYYAEMIEPLLKYLDSPYATGSLDISRSSNIQLRFEFLVPRGLSFVGIMADFLSVILVGKSQQKSTVLSCCVVGYTNRAKKESIDNLI